MSFWPVRQLTDETTPFPWLVISGWFAATVPAILLVTLAQQLLPPEMLEAIDEAVFDESLPVWVNGVSIVLFAPLVETLMMALIIFTLRKLGLPVAGQVAVSTALWAAFHGYFALAWAIAPGWIFFILSVMWVNQRRASFNKAFWSVALVHMLNNGIAFGTAFLAGEL